MSPGALLAVSPRAVLGDIKNQQASPGPSLTPANGRRKSLLPVAGFGASTTQKTPTYSRRHSSVLPEEAARLRATPDPSWKPTHKRHSSIPKSPMLAFHRSTPFSGATLKVPHTRVNPSSPVNFRDGFTAGVQKLENTPTIQHRSLPADVTSIARNAVLPSQRRTSLIAPAACSSMSKSPCVSKVSHNRRRSIPNSPMLDLSSLRTTPAAVTPRPRRPRVVAQPSSRRTTSATSAALLYNHVEELNGDAEDTGLPSQRLEKILASGDSCTTIKFPSAFSGPDATPLFLSTVSFTALKTPQLVRDDTCHLPSVAVTCESSSMLFMETPSFVALRNSPSNVFFSPPSCHDITPSRRAPALSGSRNNTRLLFTSEEDESLCATPLKDGNEPIDKGLLHPRYTNPQTQAAGCAPSQSRSLSSLMSALEKATPSLGQSLLSELAVPTSFGEDSFQLLMDADAPVATEEDVDLKAEMAQEVEKSARDTREDGGMNTNRDTLMLLDEFEILAAETRALPVPYPPSLSVTEWRAALNDSQSKNLEMEVILGCEIEELCLTSPELGSSEDGRSDDAHDEQSDTSTICTSRPSIDSGRTQSPSPPVTPLDPYFPPVVHVISPYSDPVETIIALPLNLESSSDASKEPQPETKPASPVVTPASPQPHPTPLRRTSALPRSPNRISHMPAPRRFASSPIPQKTASALPRSPALLSAPVHTPYQRPKTPNSTIAAAAFPPARPLTPVFAPTPSSGIRRLFKPRQSAPAAFQSPLAGPSANRMKRLVPQMLRAEKKSKGWGESFLEM